MPLLTILGLVFLGFLGKHYGIQEARISELGRKSNFAQVILQGQVSNEVRLHSSAGDARGESLEFDLDDGTGIMRIRCYDDTTQELLAAGKIPAEGDRVRVVGNYQFKAKRAFVILGAAADLTIQRERPATATPIRQVGKGKSTFEESRRLKVTGQVSKIWKGRYDWTWILADPQGNTLPVSIPESLLKALKTSGRDPGILHELKEGDFVTCYGTPRVVRRKGQPQTQLILSGPDDMMKADEATWKKDNDGN